MLMSWLLWMPSSFTRAETATSKPAEALYLQLGEVGIDPERVYQVRGAALNRPGIQITLEDGTIGFTQDVMGRITGAFFEGYGEVLLTPPNEVERRSMSLFTGMAILEERFETAYFRFNDDAAAELSPDLRSLQDKQEFMTRWGGTVRNLATGDAMRLLTTFSRMLPVAGAQNDPPNSAGKYQSSGDHFLHARLQGSKLGVFDVYYDSMNVESVQAGQLKNAESGGTYYDVWTSFATVGTGAVKNTASPQVQKPAPGETQITVDQYRIATDVVPPKQIRSTAKLQCEIHEAGLRALLFELSRYLQIGSVKLNGDTVEFIHNPALEGTQLSRQGNDVVAVILPQPATPGKKIELEFEYGGEVLAEAGPGLLYVGARGTWYPNRGMQMANFDLRFRYPQDWTLVATGKSAAPEQASPGAGQQVSRWISERLIPVAGFNLGKYRETATRSGEVMVQTYATQDVEKDFPSAHIQVITPPRMVPEIPRVPEMIVPSRPSPAQNSGNVGESAAEAIQYYAERFGPFPYSHLALTQMPGRESQGWPGLIFLSSYAFLNAAEREQLHFDAVRSLMQRTIPAHETAHQWWGDLVGWKSYRDQWLSEGLANYCALMMLQEKDPAGFSRVMETYRRDLVQKNKDGVSPMEAGPVTLGTRLLSSHFPGGYEAISYGRGTWLFHMLRSMLRDAEGKKSTGADEPFMRALRKVRQRYEGKAITTEELLGVFAEDIPPALRFEGKNNLDWFLDGWINGTALPKVELKNVKLVARGSGVVIQGMILQKDAPADLVTSVPVYAILSGREPRLLGRVFADGDESNFRLTAPAGTRRIVLDPYNTLLTSPK
jgi:Peptidase family M1 domain